MADEVNTQGKQEGTEQNGNGTARQPEKKYTEKAVAKLLKRAWQQPIRSKQRNFLQRRIIFNLPLETMTKGRAYVAD